MPSSSDELRAAWGGSDGVGPERAEAHLLALGFTLTRGWAWIKPSPEYEVTETDYGALRFLLNEWDYGGLVTLDEVAQANAEALVPVRALDPRNPFADPAVNPLPRPWIAERALNVALAPAPPWRPRVWHVPCSAWNLDRWFVRGTHSLRYTHYRGMIPVLWLRAFFGG